LTLLLIKVCPATIKLAILFTNNQSLGWAPPEKGKQSLINKETGRGGLGGESKERRGPLDE